MAYDFDDTPFGDPLFAALAGRFGFLPRDVRWESESKATGGYFAPGAMPFFDYGAAGTLGGRPRPAHLVVHVNDDFNYARDGRIAKVVIHHLLPDTIMRGLEGAPLTAVLDEPTLAHLVIASVTVDREREQIRISALPRDWEG